MGRMPGERIQDYNARAAFAREAKDFREAHQNDPAQIVEIEPACPCSTLAFPHYHNEMDARIQARRFYAKQAPAVDHPFAEEVHA